MASSDNELEVVDSSNLTDADWAEINRLKLAYKDGGHKQLRKALNALAEADPIRYVNVMAAFFPNMVRETIRDAMAEQGMDEDDLRELVRKLESPARDQ